MPALVASPRCSCWPRFPVSYPISRSMKTTGAVQRRTRGKRIFGGKTNGRGGRGQGNKTSGQRRRGQGNHGGLPLQSIACLSVIPWDCHHAVGAGPRACPGRIAPVFVLASVSRFVSDFPIHENDRCGATADAGKTHIRWKNQRPVQARTGQQNQRPTQARTGQQNQRPTQARTGQPRGVAPTTVAISVSCRRGRPPCLPSSQC